MSSWGSTANFFLTLRLFPTLWVLSLQDRVRSCRLGSLFGLGFFSQAAQRETKIQTRTSGGWRRSTEPNLGGGTGWWRHWVPRGRADDGKLASVEVPVSWECSCSIWGLLLVGYLSCLVLWASGASVNYLTAFNTFSAQTSQSESIACNKGCWQVQNSLRGSLVLPTQPGPSHPGCDCKDDFNKPQVLPALSLDWELKISQHLKGSSCSKKGKLIHWAEIQIFMHVIMPEFRSTSNNIPAGLTHMIYKKENSI